MREQDIILDFAVAELYGVETREINQAVKNNSGKFPDQYTQKSFMQKSGKIMADLFGEDMQTSETETKIELNFAVLKLKHTIKRKDKGR